MERIVMIDRDLPSTGCFRHPQGGGPKDNQTLNFAIFSSIYFNIDKLALTLHSSIGFDKSTEFSGSWSSAENEKEHNYYILSSMAHPTKIMVSKCCKDLSLVSSTLSYNLLV